ncbi:MAG: DUF1553 domain-containing protein, partial [Planctomycetes bacterium]|nr:DUF1553 domain-containing protein [Planctomycetota bacterium]
WPESKGIDRHRRGLYTFFWRSSPFPFLPTFDAPDGNTSCTRRSRSNTPLQALTLANDAGFVEIARGFAGRILRESSPYDEDRLQFAFRTALSREPSDREQRILKLFVQSQRRKFADDEKAARILAPSQLPKTITPAEGAAWTAVARVLLNLDEFITRE